jgi:hypothetical protein
MALGPVGKSSSRAAGNALTTEPNARRPRKRANAGSVSPSALEPPAAILAALTTHEVAFSLADAQAEVMERVNDKAQQQPTLDAIMAGAVPLRPRRRVRTASRPRPCCKRMGS